MELSPAHYERDDRSESFRLIGDVIVAVAENQDVLIDDTTHARWRDTLSLLREFDTLVDDMHMPRDEALGHLESFNYFKRHYPSLAPHSMSDEIRQRMASRVGVILKHGDTIRQTQDIDEFIHHRQEEVDHTSELLADCATSETFIQPGFYTQFMPVVRSLGRAANFLDTLLDYRQDRLEEKVRFVMTPHAAKTLSLLAADNLVRSIPYVAHKKTIRLFGDMSLMRLRNRIQYGKTPYSSIKNL